MVITKPLGLIYKQNWVRQQNIHTNFICFPSVERKLSSSNMAKIHFTQPSLGHFGQLMLNYWTPELLLNNITQRTQPQYVVICIPSQSSLPWNTYDIKIARPWSKLKLASLCSLSFTVCLWVLVPFPCLIFILFLLKQQPWQCWWATFPCKPQHKTNPTESAAIWIFIHAFWMCRLYP